MSENASQSVGNPPLNGVDYIMQMFPLELNLKSPQPIEVQDDATKEILVNEIKVESDELTNPNDATNSNSLFDPDFGASYGYADLNVIFLSFSLCKIHTKIHFVIG